MALRRWKRFFPAFGHIDAAIEAAHPSVSRDEFRSVRGAIVEMLCNAEDDDGKAEELCQSLDSVMEEYLVTLVTLRVPVPASSDAAKAISSLAQHESPDIRSRARDVARGWRSAVVEGDDNSRSRPMPPERERPVPVVSTHVPAAEAAKGETPVKDTPPAKVPSQRTPVAGSSSSGDLASDKLLATKRKLKEGYHEFEEAKRKHKIQFIDDPKMLRQQQKMMRPGPIMRERSRAATARCGSLTTVRRSLMPSLHGV